MDVDLNWLDWFHFRIIEGGLFVILIDCMIFLSPFLDVTRISLSTVSLPAPLGSGIFCPLAYDPNGLSLELTDTFYL